MWGDVYTNLACFIVSAHAVTTIHEVIKKCLCKNAQIIERRVDTMSWPIYTFACCSWWKFWSESAELLVRGGTWKKNKCREMKWCFSSFNSLLAYFTWKNTKIDGVGWALRHFNQRAHKFLVHISFNNNQHPSKDGMYSLNYATNVWCSSPTRGASLLTNFPN